MEMGHGPSQGQQYRPLASTFAHMVSDANSSSNEMLVHCDRIVRISVDPEPSQLVSLSTLILMEIFSKQTLLRINTTFRQVGFQSDVSNTCLI